MKSVVEITRELVAIPSVNPMGVPIPTDHVSDGHEAGSPDLYFEHRVARYVTDFLDSIRVPYTVTHSEFGRPNVVARIDAGCAETVLLEAHMDTVPHQGMSIDPFDPVLTDGRIYGRGSCDTKASLAVCLHVLGQIAAGRETLRRNVVFAAVHDEEFGFSGSRLLAADPPKVDFAIVGEPTSLNIVHAHKGCCRFFITAQGSTAHASTPWLGESAIYLMGDVLARVREYNSRLAEHPDAVLGPATVSVGRIEGGEAVNMVAGRCVIEVDRRLLPGETFKTAREDLAEALSSFGSRVTIEDEYMDVPGISLAPAHPACQALQEACAAAGVATEFRTANYVTDASILTAAGIPSVVFGPGRSEKAHTPDEFVEVADLEKAVDVIKHLVANRLIR